MDIFAEKRILSVSQLTGLIRGVMEENFQQVWVEGEVSNLAMPGSGHLYFTLKDAGAQLRCVMFRASARALRFQPKDGLGLIVRGRLTVYDQRGDYQLLVEYLEPKGIGALQLAFSQLKEKLVREGLFAEDHKRPLPVLPQRIGIVTSPTGAAIHDMLAVISRREEGKTVDYAVIGTGNFNETTALTYADHFLLTADRRITGEVGKVFDFLETTYKRQSFGHVVVSPFDMRRVFIKMIHREMKNARRGRPAYIDAKLNGAYIAMGLLYGKRDLDHRLIRVLHSQKTKFQRPGQLICCLDRLVLGSKIASTSFARRLKSNERIFCRKTLNDRRRLIGRAIVHDEPCLRLDRLTHYILDNLADASGFVFCRSD